MALIGDFMRALAQMADRRFLGILLGSLAITIALLLALSFATSFVVALLPATVSLPLVGEFDLPLKSLQTLAFGAVLWGSSFLMFPVAAMFVALWLDKIADAVEAKHYPTRLANRSPGLVESLKAGLWFALVVIAVNLLALIPALLAALFLGPLAVIIPILVNGYLLGREYFQLVAERHIPIDKAGDLRRRHRFRVWFAGSLMAVPLAVPILNLIIPVLGVATFTHQFHRLAAR